MSLAGAAPGSPARRRPAVAVRRLRAVPAALPDVPRHRRGGAVAPRPDRRDARRAVAWRRARRRVRAVHGHLRAVPRLRAGVPERGAVRSADGGHPPCPGRSPPHRAPVAAGGVRRPRSPPVAARRLVVARRGQRRGSCPAGWVCRLLPMRRPPRLRPTGTDVWLFTGCVMDAWHARRPTTPTAALSGRPGRRTPFRGPAAACCGALHVHAGLARPAARLARRVMASMPGDAPILVNSAGCGAALKDYGHLLGTVGGGGILGAGASTSTSGWPRAWTGCRLRPRGSPAR